MQKRYYKIIREDNDKPYAYYLLKILWNVDNIINDNCKNGYIVQKVNITNTTKIKGLDDIEYYEAWKVINGKVENIDNYDYDDIFMWYDSFTMDMCLEHSKGKKGEISYYCEVFWVSENNILYEEVNLWKKGIPLARDLKSILASEFKYDLGTPIFCRKFTHKVDYDNDN